MCLWKTSTSVPSDPLTSSVPGKLNKFGLDYESLKALNPGLIYCSITGR
jgi:crotonobetainyl-CoA:carnitine CoA-transferase CaiB-like acyl-CoA transferase